nr:hypothetical protein [Allomuricauda sp.]
MGTIKLDSTILHLWEEDLTSSISLNSERIELDDFTLRDKKLLINIPKKIETGKRVFTLLLKNKHGKGIFLMNENPFGVDSLSLSITEIDENLEVVNETKYDFDLPNDEFSINTIQQTGENQFLMLTKLYYGKNILRKDFKKEYEYQLFKLDQGNLHKLATISNQGKHLRSLEMLHSDSGEVILSGIYSEKDLYGMRGVYFCKLNGTSGAIVAEKFHPITPDFSLRLMEESKKKQNLLKNREGKPIELPYYILQDIVPVVQDGHKFILLAEQIHSVTVYTQTKYYHDNVAMFQLDTNGNLEWSNILGKRQLKDNVPIYSSFLPFPKNGKVHLFYNGNINNKSHTTGKVEKAFGSEGVLFLTTIQENGGYVRNKVASVEELEGIFGRPSLYSWLDEHTVIFFGQDINNVKNQRFIKVTLNKYL